MKLLTAWLDAYLAVYKVHQRSAGDILHDHIHHLPNERRLQQVNDVGMLQVGQDIDFLLNLLYLADVPEVAGVHLLHGHKVTCISREQSSMLHLMNDSCRFISENDIKCQTFSNEQR